MNREVYPKVKHIISESMKEAKSFDDVKVRPEHIVLSILLDDDNDCVTIFRRLNVNTSELYDRISDYLRKNDITPRIVGNNKRTLPFSDETKAIIKSLDNECENLNDNMIDIIHVMLAILSKNTPSSEILYKHFGVNYNSFKQIIKEMREGFSNSAYENDEPEEESFRKKTKGGDTKTKTPVLDNFCRDISKAVEKGEIDPVVGRSVEIKRVSQILSRRKKNNPVLIGDPGVGKCICIDTKIVMRNDLTGEVFETSIFNLLNTISNT
jgi:ATP-dependent Clp protease ATP-binding subunit ClpC